MSLSKDYKPLHAHIYCDECRSVIGAWDRENYTCGTCHKEFKLYKLKYDGVIINDVTGWIFPIVDAVKGDNI